VQEIGFSCVIVFVTDHKLGMARRETLRDLSVARTHRISHRETDALQIIVGFLVYIKCSDVVELNIETTPPS